VPEATWEEKPAGAPAIAGAACVVAAGISATSEAAMDVEAVPTADHEGIGPLDHGKEKIRVPFEI
jgi:hypothetical protein